MLSVADDVVLPIAGCVPVARTGAAGTSAVMVVTAHRHGTANAVAYFIVDVCIVSV
jgi:hypothetical protein